MVSEPERVTQYIMPTQVWALMPLERQQQVVRLLAHLAVHLIAVQTSCQQPAVSAKERGDAYPSSRRQDSA